MLEDNNRPNGPNKVAFKAVHYPNLLMIKMNTISAMLGALQYQKNY
jgi:hypothetical protein